MNHRIYNPFRPSFKWQLELRLYRTNYELWFFNRIKDSRALSRALKSEDAPASLKSPSRSSTPEIISTTNEELKNLNDFSRAASRIARDALENSKSMNIEEENSAELPVEASRAASRMAKGTTETTSRQDKCADSKDSSKEASRVASRMARTAILNQQDSSSSDSEEDASKNASRMASRMAKETLQKDLVSSSSSDSDDNKEDLLDASKEASRIASRMAKVAVQKEEVYSTDFADDETKSHNIGESSEASRIASRMANDALKNEMMTSVVAGEALEDGLLSANASRAVSRKSFNNSF